MTPMELAALAMKCGLRVATVQDLVVHGWEYVEEINQPGKWIKKF